MASNALSDFYKQDLLRNERTMDAAKKRTTDIALQRWAIDVDMLVCRALDRFEFNNNIYAQRRFPQ